jgi:precorrin-2/cobalt-factor-2 C20-methyltransferase
MTPGTLTGVGLGPGDPGLVTLKAAELIRTASLVAYPAPEGGESFARRIAAGLIGPAVREMVLPIPMSPDPAVAEPAYDRAAAKILRPLEDGTDVLVLCEGDPLFYGSFIYLLARLNGRVPIRVVPGVSSVQAGAAALNLPLAGRDDRFAVLPATLEDKALEQALTAADCAVIIKLGRHLPRIRALVERLNLAERAYYLAQLGLPAERAMPLALAPPEAPYFSMIIISRGAGR